MKAHDQIANKIDTTRSS